MGLEFKKIYVKIPHHNYDSLFSLEIVEVISDNLSANRSMSACDILLSIFFEYILTSTNKD